MGTACYLFGTSTALKQVVGRVKVQSMTGGMEGAGSDLVVVSGDKEFAGLSLDLLILLQSDDCCHSGEHWDVCNQHTQPPSQFNTAKLSYKLL